MLRKLINVFIVITLAFGTVGVAKFNVKIISTSAQLVILGDNAQYYNEQHRKTDEMTAKYNENDSERKAIYNSDDVVIRTFSNQHFLVKFLGLMLAIACMLMIPVMWFYVIERTIVIAKKKRERRKKQSYQKHSGTN